jgi:hypothetical protein
VLTKCTYVLDASAAEIEQDIEQKKKILNRKVSKAYFQLPQLNL